MHELPPQVDRIVLTGFMGSGKSTAGRLLARRLGWEFIDLDAAVEQRCGKTVTAIFAEHGETHFRSEESAALAPLLKRSRLVVALGGGAPEAPSNRELLQVAPSSAVVYLEAPFEVLLARCSTQEGAAKRPLLADRDAALARFHDRHKFYQAIATLRIDTTRLSADDVVRAILQQLA